MHALPQLAELEDRYRSELVVVGVHTAKFTQERELDNVRRAILRYDIGHPVANDPGFDVWRRWGIRAWPTFMFIGPDGNVIGKHEGEFDLRALDSAIAGWVTVFDRAGLIDRTPLHFPLERDRMAAGPLSFPGKVLADAGTDTLIISDSNHHRLVIADLGGRVRDVVGSGEAGLEDGDYGAARFRDPQGLALDGDLLYVADTKNHAVRLVNMSRRSVETLAGTGAQARAPQAGPGRTTALKSPWDVILAGSDLFIAMAGFHQIWRLDLSTGDVAPHAGSGRENIVDGPLPTAQLAQPSGIAARDGILYFADSETSAIRTADIGREGSVSTIVGEDLFSFGDQDGTGRAARLQHPLGVDVAGGFLYLADTYNNRIKRIELATGQVTTLFGSGEPGLADGPGPEARFHEPGGVAVAGDRAYVADTNNHAVRIADLIGGSVSTLPVVP